jgi:aspartate kinase
MPGELVVMKFGGTSVADPERIRRAAERAIRLRRAGGRVVVVVSAPGEMTDELIALAKQLCPSPDRRELDMLMATGEQVSISLFAIACRALGAPAVSLTGPQAGIRADAAHTKAHIVEIRPEKIREELAAGRIVTVAGFQGLNEKLDIATLGRGGSDLTAVALAAALRAKRCEIYTDVDGVYTADPRLVPEARLIPRLSYDEMLELAASGAQVMQSRSIEVAKKFRVPVRVASAFSPRGRGTWITREVPGMEEALVSGVALDPEIAILTLHGVPDKPGALADIFVRLGRAQVNVDLITQSSPQAAFKHVSLSLPVDELPAAEKALREMRRRVPGLAMNVDRDVAKLSVIGVGMRSHSGVAGRIFQTMARERIDLKLIATSEISVSCVVERRDATRALRALHRTFGLQRRPRSK